MQTDRRTWLKQTALVLAALGWRQSGFAGGEAPPIVNTDGNAILLNSNENAYGPSPAARRAILVNYLLSNRYPDDLITPLVNKIAAQWSVAGENILLGAGASEIIGLGLLLASLQNRQLLTADPSYNVWERQAKALGFQFNKVPLNSSFNLDLDKMLAAYYQNKPSFIYICNPNNPTGTFTHPEVIKSFTQEVSKDSLVFIDEAYTEYAGLPSLATYAVTNPNVIVAKTFSKIYGLAGARVGYAIAHPATIQKLGNLQPWPNANVSVVSAAAATGALNDASFVQDCKQKCELARTMCYTVLDRLKLTYIPSSTNFILFNIDSVKANLVEQLGQRKIYVQQREHFGGKWCRVSMGTVDEMLQFNNALEEIVTQKSF
ncbi:MAG TPA: histidinol-phosphate transaminase [Chitinophagaceae bacterium]|jgi:histidinol-phosphate aminotransferase|nr:histidinol-phosphate transaminase [Chitinophagaceae bacterium]